MLLASLLMSMSSDAIVFPDMVPMYDLTLLLTVLNLSFYFIVLKITGYADRSVQSLSAILGIDAFLTVIYLGGFLLVGLAADRPTALTMAWLLSCWSVPVEGHIISRAIGRHWSIGIVIAIVAYSLLFLTYLQFVDQP